MKQNPVSTKNFNLAKNDGYERDEDVGYLFGV